MQRSLMMVMLIGGCSFYAGCGTSSAPSSSSTEQPNVSPESEDTTAPDALDKEQQTATTTEREAELAPDVDEFTFRLEPLQGVVGSLVDYYEPKQIALSAKPGEELHAEPQYASDKVMYGAMQLGDGTDTVVTVVVDEADGQSPRVYVDRNNDEDLTNDGAGVWSETSSSSLRLSDVAIDVEYTTGTAPYTFDFYRFKHSLREFVLYYRDAARTGELTSEGKSYKIVILDENADARFDDLDGGTLIIDLNQDGKLLGDSHSAEHHKLGEPFNIHGAVWEVVSLSPDGTLLKLRPSDGSVAMKMYLDPGTPAPIFTGEDLDGNTIDLTDEATKAKYVLLDFWASWCGPCRSEYPYFRRLHARYKDSGLRILGVNLDSSRNRAVKAAQENLLDYPHVFDGQGRKNAVAVLYRVHSLPETFLLDKDLNIVAKGLRGSRLESQMAEFLGPGDTEAVAALEAEMAKLTAPNRLAEFRSSLPRQVQEQFQAIGYAKLKEADLSAAKINGSNDPQNQLLAGTILAAKTNQGRYSKFVIEEYGYDLVMSWITYGEDGDIHSQGRGLTIGGTWGCDLDAGQESGADEDFWWQHINKTKRYLVPGQGAQFAIVFRPPQGETE